MTEKKKNTAYGLGDPITFVQLQKYSRISLRDAVREYMGLEADSWISVRKGIGGTVILEKYTGEFEGDNHDN